jgi:hypothetical protein
MEFKDINRIIPGNYYRLRLGIEHQNKGWNPDNITDDRMYLVTDFRHDTVSFMGIFPRTTNSREGGSPKAAWTCTEDEFLDVFDFCQEASDERQRLVDELLVEAHKPMDQEMGDVVAKKLEDLYAKGDHMLLEGPQDAKRAQDSPVPSSAIDRATTPQERAALVQRDRIAEVRSLLQEKRDELEMRNTRIELAIQEKTALMEAKMKGVMAMIRSMQYMVNAMNVYLGIGEECKIIREGRRASADEKLVVRQLVLYADEECALHADTGGIDFRDLHTFIDWMVDSPERIDQIIPEAKSIVAMRMRREDKRYGDDPLANAKLNDENKKTWFIVRNGEVLHYIRPEFNVRDRLFPTSHELDRIFAEEKLYDNSERPIRPGEHRWIEAVDNADNKKKQMMIGLLFLQGLVDRTDLLTPWPTQDRPNLVDPVDHEKNIIYLRDAEMILHDGRPSWREYQYSTNSRLGVGCRVIGYWQHDREDHRCTPHYCSPEEGQCYMIHRSDADGHYFKFEISNYPGEYSGKKTRNISWQIKDYDDCFINIDEVTEEDLVYYMTDRVNRRHYARMLPVLQRALAFLRREREDEKPFRMLVAGEIAKKDGADIAWDSSRMDALVNWWKFKNKFRRAIDDDNAKALRMIVRLFDKFSNRNAKLGSLHGHASQLVEEIKAEYPRTLFIGADDNGRLTAFVACYDDRDVWYRQHFFDKAGKEIQEPKLMADPWHYVAYPELYCSKRWENWGKWDRGTQTLKDDDQEILVDWAMKTLPGVADGKRHLWIGHERPKYGEQHPGACFRLLAAVQDGNKITFWFQDHAYYEEADHNEGSSPTISFAKVKWERKGRKNTLVITPLTSYSNLYSYNRFKALPGEEPWRGKSQHQNEGRPFWIDKDAENQWHEDYHRWKASPTLTSKKYSDLITRIAQDHDRDIRYTWMEKYARHLRAQHAERAMGNAEQREAWVANELDRFGYSCHTKDGIPLGPHLEKAMEAVRGIAYKGLGERDRMNGGKRAYEQVCENLRELRTAQTLRGIFAMNGTDVGDEWLGPDRDDIDNIPFLDEPIAWSEYDHASGPPSDNR